MTEGEPGNTALRAWVRALERSAAGRQRTDATLAGLIEERALERPNAPALMTDGERLTYAALAERSRRYARWALRQGVQAGEVVGLLMTNRPEYVAGWLGITRVGGVVALLNTNLAGDALLHCVTTVSPSHVIAESGFVETLAMLAGALGGKAVCWAHGADHPGFRRIDAVIDAADPGPLKPAEQRPPTRRDTALLIYTSGTTGLPKAARVSHGRLMEWSLWFAGMMDATSRDRMYDCLPMYHSVGGVVAVGALLVSGGSVVIRPRFSAARFWDEVVGWECTLFQYIGELCRYLVNAPPHALERAHRLRLCCGNGLRPDVWERFQARFALPAILEFYAATEGNVTLYNCEGKPGAIGRVPGFLAHRTGVALARLEPDTGELARDAAGRCGACAVGEVGEALGRISSDNFEGYTDPGASARKVAHDVFRPGDSWFRTGDLMRKDAAGFYSFVDRLGDTFRWKGENVSTTEVADVVAACPGVIDAVVFGVLAPGAEGRAGMAAIVTAKHFSLAALRGHLAERLPAYARPVFIRLCQGIEATGTFKLAKGRLAGDGYGPNSRSEPCYLDDRAANAYVPIDDAMRARIANGMRL